MKKLLELIADDKELKAELDDALASKRAEGVVVGKAEGIKEAKAQKNSTKEEAKEKPPECFKKYKATYEKQPRVCRACKYSPKCKGNK